MIWSLPGRHVTACAGQPLKLLVCIPIQTLKLDSPIELEASDLALHNSSPDAPESSRDGGSTMTAERAENVTGEAYSAADCLAADMDVDSGLSPDLGVALSHVSPFTAAAALPAEPPLADVSRAETAPPLPSLTTLSPFALAGAAAPSPPFDGDSPSLEDSATFEFPCTSQPDSPCLSLLPQRPTLLNFARAASDGVSLMRSHALGPDSSPYGPASALPPIRPSSTARPPIPLKHRTCSVPYPAASMHEPDTDPLAALNARPPSSAMAALNPHFPGSAPASQPWAAEPVSAGLGDTFDEILQQYSEEPALFSGGSLLGTSRVLDTARAASVPGPLTGIDRTDMLDEAFSFGAPLMHMVQHAALVSATLVNAGFEQCVLPNMLLLE